MCFLWLWQSQSVFAVHYQFLQCHKAELLELGEEYFLCLDQVESDNFGTYYLIMGGNQGYGTYDSSSGYVQMINDVDRSVFDTFSIETPESVSIDCISNFVDNTRVETRAITPAEGHKWNECDLFVMEQFAGDGQ